MFFRLSFDYPDYDCETCHSDIIGIANATKSEEVIAKLLEILSGEALCQNPSLVATDEESEICKGFAREFVPAAINYLTDVLVENIDETCIAIFDVC